MRKTILAALLFLFTANLLAEDIGNMIQATPTTTVIQSNTPVIFKFMTGKTRNYVDAGYPSSEATATQWDRDGTSYTLYRGKAYSSLEIANYTTYTMYIALNPSNETTPTLSSTRFWTALPPVSSGIPYRVTLDGVVDTFRFPVGAVAVMLSDATTRLAAGVTSATISVKGM